MARVLQKTKINQLSRQTLDNCVTSESIVLLNVMNMTQTRCSFSVESLWHCRSHWDCCRLVVWSGWFLGDNGKYSQYDDNNDVLFLQAHWQVRARLPQADSPHRLWRHCAPFPVSPSICSSPRVAVLTLPIVIRLCPRPCRVDWRRDSHLLYEAMIDNRSFTVALVTHSESHSNDPLEKSLRLACVFGPQ
jgi:hypothetical protein